MSVLLSFHSPTAGKYELTIESALRRVYRGVPQSFQTNFKPLPILY